MITGGDILNLIGNEVIFKKLFIHEVINNPNQYIMLDICPTMASNGRLAPPLICMFGPDGP